MKFGKHIQAQTIPEWAAHYMNYKALKKIINELSAPLSPTTNSAEAAKQRLQTVKASFFFQVDRELEKVNTFYLQKEADTKVRLKSLIEKQRNLRSRGPRNRTVTMRALHEAFLNSRHDLDKLQNFVEINGTGFRKILKKWDKRSKSSTKELYLARQVEVQPCFNQDVIAELSDMVTKCLSELEHALDQAAEDPLPPREPQQGELGLSPLHSTASVPGDMDVADELAKEAKQTVHAIHRRNSSGFLLDMGISRGVQVDRAEAELFHALSLSSTQKAGELLEQYKAQQTDVQRSCVTRVLWRACSEIREPEKQQMLLDSGLADLHSVDDINERTLVHEASIHGSLAILQAAVAAGCDPDEADYYDRRPVHYAAINSHIDCLKFLIDKGSSVCAIDDDGSHAFDYAMINGHVECVRMLLDHDPNIVCGDSEYPVLALACEKGHEDIVHMLLEAGAKLSLNAQGMHPMHVAARAGYTGILRMLLDHGAPVNVLDKDLGWTPVFYAANEGNVECIRVLLDSGCNLDVLDENGRGPTYFAASEGHMECVDVLIKAAGAKIDEDDKTSSTAKAGQEAGETADHNAADTNADLDLDAIPSLSLPPPLIPFRVYGHNFLGKRTRIHIRMHSRSGANASPVSFVDHRDTVSLKLVAVAKPDAGMVPHTIMLPMETSSTMFGFQTDSLDNFRIEFMLYPSFGLQPIGKAVALASQFTDASSGIAQLPLLDRYLKVVAEISFEFLVIRPFEGAQLQIGGKVETYWKSTNPALQQNAHSMAVSAMVPGFSSSPSRQLPSTGATTTPISSAIFTSPTSVTDSLAGAGAGAGGIPIIISSSLAPEHVCIQVQVCRDGVPVVSPRMYIDVGSPSGVKLRIHSLTYSELQGAMRAESNRQAVDSNEKPDGQNGTASEWHQYLYDSGLSLEKVLEMLPTRFGVSLQVLDNSLAWSGTNSKLRSQRHDINDYIDAILKTVYQDSLKSARNGNSGRDLVRTGGEPLAEQSTEDSQPKANTQRNTIFCSYSPSICVALNWKQPNYAVFLMTSGREAPDSDDSFNKDAPSFGPYTNHLPLKEAVRFASANNILGIMCRSSLLTRVPSLIRNVKDNGLLLVSFGRENYDEQLCAAQKSHGVDAIICDGTIKYETEDNVEYVI
ncbi:phosphate system positive regulatory protein pho81 [Coemansia sp. RSA 990]|nr:phosphate system positive regulatory protein pho81 [Coemansia sp. RSA 1821]KAJ1872619.1 phosphate system positive regulatory protein pho81 [Coemansia sp. RSA 990]KAJ2675558.1 phosphate system positive regulatory protein pho81 [Coemansia sp. RSA 1085]